MTNDIFAHQLVPMNIFAADYPISINLIYANPDDPDNHFANLYHPEASIVWAHQDMAMITLAASVYCNELYGWTLQLIDCLRPIEAQEKMANYGYHPSLVSLPGSGGHPRAMAMDVIPLDEQGQRVDMGTAFDFFVDDPELENPAARHYTKFKDGLEHNANIWLNRQRLEFAFRYAATSHNMLIDPLAQEWWDFRLLPEHYERHPALSENDLLPCQRLIDCDTDTAAAIIQGNIPRALQPAIDAVQLAL